VFTADHLYIAVRCFDSEPNRILAAQMGRDAESESDDFVSVAFDTFARERDGYLFGIRRGNMTTPGLRGRTAKSRSKSARDSGFELIGLDSGFPAMGLWGSHPPVARLAHNSD
jgi:hypothetical protein